ncbi:hypothetical protein [Rahnella sp. ChDrAdgB13]|uniref:hypothetical protein n=1 Tax=Rahnella sp. ChDrAdgB13 TaxID=1850581 RepID=UPI001AD850F3|nr:hypothetical protein [Rahnella sp. ChDrAdgB13]
MSKLVSDWETFSKSPDAKITMQAISSILATIVKAVGELIRLTGSVVGWFDKWLGSANSIAFVIGSMFLISKWAAIVQMAMSFGRYLREVATAMELVAAGEETITALGILMDAVLAPIALIPIAIVAAVFAIGTLINQWGKFKDGMSTGFLKDFFTTFDNGITRMMAWLRYWLDYLDIGTLKMRDMLSKAHMAPALTDDEKKDLASKQAEHNGGVGAYVDREVAINTDKRNTRQRFADVAATMHRQHPDWDKQQIAQGIAQQDPQLWASRLVARDDDNAAHAVATGAGTGKTYQSGAALNTPAAAAPQTTDNSLHVHVDHVSVTADSPQDFAHQMQQGLASANAGLASTMANQGAGGRKP